MSDRSEDLAAIERAVAELLPSLTERLARHQLGEIEVRQGELRLRLAAGEDPAPTPPVVETEPTPVISSLDGRPGPEIPDVESTVVHVASPAVGYFMYAEGLGPGLSVEGGGGLGYVDVLGVRHEVRAPIAGTVRGLAAESGEAVEYGQPLLELERTG